MKETQINIFYSINETEITRSDLNIIVEITLHSLKPKSEIYSHKRHKFDHFILKFDFIRVNLVFGYGKLEDVCIK